MEKKANINSKIEGSMKLALLNRIYKMNAISNATYLKIKEEIIKEYRIS